MNRKKEARRLSWGILIIVIPILILIFCGLAFSTITLFQKALTRSMSEKLVEQVKVEAAKMNIFLSEGKAASYLAYDIEALDNYDVDLIGPIIKKYLEKHNEVISGGYWLEPYVYKSDLKYYGPFYYKDGKEIILSWEYNTDAVNYLNEDWYKLGFTGDDSLKWSEPYIDPVTKVLMITSVAPIVKDGKRIGVTTMDVSLANLDQYISGIKFGRNGLAFLITSTGYYMSFPDKDRNLKVRITEEKEGLFTEIGKAISEGASDGIYFGNAMNDTYVATIQPVGDTGIKMVAMMPRSEFYDTRDVVLKVVVISVIIAIMALSLLIWHVINIRVNRPLSSLLAYADKISAGDLTVSLDINRKDEIGEIFEAFRKVQVSMKDIVKSIMPISSKLTDNASALLKVSQSTTDVMRRIRDNMNNLNNIAESNASVVEETNAGIEEISSAAQTSARESTKGVDAASNVFETAKITASVMDESVKELRTVGQFSQQSMHNVQDLAETVSKISEFVNVISNIAAQTNLLALNAAIEAARAGEAGRGFAVVAEEVRKLAEKSGEAADEISSTMDGLLGKSQETVASAQESTRKLDAIIGKIVNTKNKIDEFLQEISKITDVIQSIAAASEEQSASIQEIASGMDQLASHTSETAHMASDVYNTLSISEKEVEQIKSQAENLQEFVAKLGEIASRFKIDSAELNIHKSTTISEHS